MAAGAPDPERRRRTRRLVAAALGAGGAAAIVVALAARSLGPESLRPLRIARGGDLVSLDPLLLESTTQFTVSNVFEGLVKRGRHLSIEPGLAERWTIPDERTWLFDLRRGARFHDGAPVTASEVKAAFDRVRSEPDAPGKHLLAGVLSVAVEGERSLRFTTREADPFLLQRLALFRIARGATTREVVDRLVGTGPYRIVRWSQSGTVELEAFGGYWNGRPEARRVEIVPLPAEQRLAALSRGEVDVAVIPGATDLTQASPDVTLVRQVSLSRMFLWFCAADARGPLADRQVRQAISLAVDRRALAQDLVGDPEAAAYQLVPRVLFGFAPALAPEATGAEAARAALARSAWPRGFETPLSFAAQSALSVRTAERVREALEPLRIRTQLQPTDARQVLAAFAGHGVGLLASLWTFDDGDAGSFLRDCVRSRDASAALGSFNPGYSDAETDAAIDAALTVVDDHDRLLRYHAIMGRLARETPVVPLFDQVVVVGLRRGLVWRPRPDALILAEDIVRAR